MSTTATNDQDRELSLTAAAARSGRCERTLSRWIADGILRAQRDPISRRLKIRARDLDALLKAETVTPTAEV